MTPLQRDAFEKILSAATSYNNALDLGARMAAKDNLNNAADLFKADSPVSFRYSPDIIDEDSFEQSGSDFEANSIELESKAGDEAEAILVEIRLRLEAANVLVSSGLAANEDIREDTPAATVDFAFDNNVLSESSVEDTTVPPRNPADAKPHLETAIAQLRASLEGNPTAAPVEGALTMDSPIISPKEVFDTKAIEVLKALAPDAEKQAQGILEALKKIDLGKISEALINLTATLNSLPHPGSLLRKGLDLLIDSLQALLAWLRPNAVKAIADKAKEFVDDLFEGKFTQVILNYAWQVDAAETQLIELQSRVGISDAAYSDGLAQLSSLRTNFQAQLAQLAGIAAAILSVHEVLNWFGYFATPSAVLMPAGMLGLILCALILIGLDYTDQGSLLRRVTGVVDIAKSLAV